MSTSPAGSPPPATAPAADLVPRLLCCLYEGLLLAGTLVAAGFLLVPLGHSFGFSAEEARTWNRSWMFLVVSAYFVWFWTHGGQTLPMKTWRIRIEGPDRQPPGLDRALLRMVLAWAGWGLFGAHFLWAVFDRDRQFLHDRLLGTRIVSLDAG